MMPAGRKSSIPLEDLKILLYKYKDIFASKLPPISDNVYKEIQEEIRCKYQIDLSTKGIQCSIKRHQDFFQTVEHSDAEAINNKSDCYTSSELEITFQIDIYDLRTLNPCNYRLQKNKWTNELQDKIWANSKLQCTFAFKNNYVPSNLKLKNIKCEGKCSQCGALLSVRLFPITDNFVNVICNLTNFNNDYVHDSNIKNRLTHFRKTQLMEKLVHKKALAVRSTIANEQIDIDDKCEEAPTLPTLTNLRKIRHEARSALQFDKNPILSIYAMSDLPPYDSFIRKFCIVPFFIYFWSNEQGRFYDEFLQDDYVALSIDATGSIFQKISPQPVPGESCKKTKHLFLYAVVAYTSSSSVPLSYMASQSHTIDAIAAWLTSWLENRKTPNEIVSDDSSALLGAIARTFLNSDTNKYLSQCFSLLEGKTNTVTACFIRLDKSHFIKNLYKQACFENVTDKCKYFYINIIKELLQLDDYQKLKCIIKDIITVSLHKHVSLGIEKSRCKEAIIRLKNLFNKSTDFTNKSDLEDSDEDEIRLSMLKEENTSTEINFDLILFYEQAIKNEEIYLILCDPDLDEENHYYFPKINDTLKRLLKKLPLWGNVMLRYFPNAKKVASSSNVENHFKDIKTIYFSTKVDRIRLDHFLIGHFNYINGSVKLNISDRINKTKNLQINNVETKNQYVPVTNLDLRTEHESAKMKRKSQTKNTKRVKRVKAKVNKNDREDFGPESIFQDKPILLENWRGLSINKKIIRNNKYCNSLVKDKDGDQLCTIINPDPVHILNNGNFSSSIDKDTIIMNTCAFDSISQAFAVAYKDRTVFRQLIDSFITSDSFSIFIKDLAMINNDSSSKHIEQVYVKRDEIIKKAFGTETKNETNFIIDCATNITTILEKICITFYSASRKRVCSNNACDSFNQTTDEFKCKYLPLNLNIIQREGIVSIKRSLVSAMATDHTPTCSVCKIGLSTFRYQINSIIIFELHDLHVNVENVPLNLEIDNKSYDILAVVEFVSSSMPEGVGHYKAHCFRLVNKTYQTFDDLFDNFQEYPLTRRIVPHAIIYTQSE